MSSFVDVDGDRLVVKNAEYHCAPKVNISFWPGDSDEWKPSSVVSFRASTARAVAREILACAERIEPEVVAEAKPDDYFKPFPDSSTPTHASHTSQTLREWAEVLSKLPHCPAVTEASNRVARLVLEAIR